MMSMAKQSTFFTRNRRAVVAFIAGMAIAGGGAYAVTSNSPKLSACVDNRTKVMYLTEKPSVQLGEPWFPGTSPDLLALRERRVKMESHKITLATC